MEDLSVCIFASKPGYMKKTFLVAGFALALTLAASAQSNRKAPPPPPKPPTPPAEAVHDVPPPPPPPPMAPPPPPPMPTTLSKETIAGLPQDYQDFLKRNPSVGSVNWHEESVFVVLRNGEVEQYSLNEEGIKQAEGKYGKLPQAPPPPPPPKAPKPPKSKQ